MRRLHPTPGDDAPSVLPVPSPYPGAPAVLETLRQDLAVVYSVLSILQEDAAVPTELQAWLRMGLTRLRDANAKVVTMQRRATTRP